MAAKCEFATFYANKCSLIIILTGISRQFIYIATLDQCTSEQLTNNPVVQTWSIDAPLEVDDPDIPQASSTPTNRSASAKSRRRRSGEEGKARMQSGTQLKRKEDIVNGRNFTANDLHVDIQGRSDPTTGSLFKEQTSSPGQLQWLSTISRYPQLSGNF